MADKKKAGAAGKSTASMKDLEKSLTDKKTTAPSVSGAQMYANEITNKLKESLKKQLQAVKGVPEKLKSVRRLS